MRAKTIVTGVLVLFVAVSIVYLVAEESRDDKVDRGRAADRVRTAGAPSEGGTDGTRTGPRAFDEIVVYYFHGNVRCATCRKIEAYAEEAIRTNFPSELASGRMRWLAVNVDEPENAHFVEDYRLVTRSLVLVGVEKDDEKAWRNLDKIWETVGSQTEFTDYVVKSTREFMAGNDG